MPACRASRELRCELVLPQGGQHEEAADVEHVGRSCECGREVGGAERGVRAEGVDEPAVFSGHRDDHRLRGVEPVRVADAGDVEAGRAQLVLDERAEVVVSHLRDDRGSHAEPRERDRGVRGTAAGLDDEVVGRHELSCFGQALEWRHEHVRDDDPGADDLQARPASHRRRRLRARSLGR